MKFLEFYPSTIKEIKDFANFCTRKRVDYSFNEKDCKFEIFDESLIISTIKSAVIENKIEGRLIIKDL